LVYLLLRILISMKKCKEVVIAMVPSLSAGTGPAAGILIGGILILGGNAAGWLVLLGGFGLSMLWACR
jgi:hypothetical protein